MHNSLEKHGVCIYVNLSHRIVLYSNYKYSNFFLNQRPGIIDRSLSALLNKFHNSFLVKGQLDALEEAQTENNQTEPDPANNDAEVMESNVDEETGNTVPTENGGNEA